MTIAFIFILLPGAIFADEAKQPSIILFISSSSDSNRAVAMEAAFTEKWREREQAVSVFHFMHYSYSLPQSERDTDFAIKYLKERFAERSPDLIVAQADYAAQFSISLRDIVFPKTPVVAFDMTPNAKEHFAGISSIYLLESSVSGLDNIEFARKIFPDRKRIVIFLITGPSLATQDFVKKETEMFFPDMDVIVLPNPTSGDADAVLFSSIDDTFILNFYSGWIDNTGRQLSGKAFTEHIAKHYKVPVFEYIRENLGVGSVGGVGVSAKTWGQAAADLGLSLVLDAKEAPFWSSSTALNSAFADYQVLSSFGVQAHAIPKNIELINTPPDFWNRYRTYIQTIIAVLIIALMLLSLRAWSRRRERRLLVEAKRTLEQEVAERTSQLSESNQELSAANENLVALMRKTEAMQENVLRSAREITLGRLAYGFANGLNSPLAAARSAISSFRSFAGGGIIGAPTFIMSLFQFDDKQRALFARYAPTVLRRLGTTGLHEPETLRRQLEERLGTLLCEDPSGTASDLIDAGLDSFEESELSAFAPASARPVVRSLYGLSVLERSINITEEAVERAIDAVKAVRDYVSDTWTENPETTANLRATVDRALLLFKTRLSPPIILKTELNNLPPVVGAETRYVRLWAHLIQNALQAMPTGGELAIKIYQEGQYANVEVSDQGPGIPKEIADKIFEPFVTTREIAEGMGLGLPFCKRIAESYGGSIAFSSTSQGTSFRISLPLAEASD